MSHASILFLKSESESVMQVLNEHGSFHLELKEVEPRSSEYADKIYELLNNAKDLSSKTDSLLGAEAFSSVNPLPYTPLDTPDWPSFIKTVDEQLSPYSIFVNDLDSKVQEETKTKEQLEIWEKVVAGAQSKVDLHLLNAFQKYRIKILFNDLVPQSKLAERIPATSVVVDVSATPSIAIVAYLPSDEEKIQHAAEDLGYRTVEPMKNMPQDFSGLPDFLKGLRENLTKMSELNQSAKKSLAEKRSWLSYMSTTLCDAYSVLSLKEKAALEKNWGLLEGYVPTRVEKILSTDLTSRLNGRVIMFAKDVQSSSSPKVPTTYRYPKFFKWFESITNLYGWPAYNEINPTFILAITFPIFFGLMFGDVGHGLIFAALGYFIYKYMKGYQTVGLLFCICGIFGAVIGGIAYGEAFGLSFSELTGGLITYSGNLSINGGATIGNLFRLSIYIGIAQMLLGMSITLINGFWQRKKEEVLLVRLPKILLYLILVYIFLTVLWTKTINFSVLTPPLLLLIAPAIFLLVAKPAYITMKYSRKEGISHFGESGIDVFETLLMYVSNTVSYLRIFAMVAAHVELTLVFYVIGELIFKGVGGPAGLALQWSMIILGNALVIALEGLIVFAQDLRLHFYEWFSKFYDDGGVRFNPFRLTLGVPIIKRINKQV
jgi:V/A-type H+-transporting ATPase subunit I